MFLAFGLFIYLLIEHEIKHIEKNKKILNNYLSFIHILLCITIYGTGLLVNRPRLFKSLMYANTGGFFINEISFFYKEKIFTTMNFVLTFHHIIVLYFISKSNFNSYVYFLLTAAEVTNLPGCILYNYIQKKKKLNIKDKDYEIPCEALQKKIQLLIYVLIRVFISPYFVYKLLMEEKDNNHIEKLFFILIYLLGVVWSIKLCKSYNKPI